LAAAAVKNGTTVDAFKSQLLTELRASRSTIPSQRYREDTPDLMQCCLLLATGNEKAALKFYGPDNVMKARATGLNSVPDIARRTMELSGLTGLPQNSKGILRASFSTSAFTNLLSGSMDKILQTINEQIVDSWRAFCKIRTLNNYRSTAILKPTIDANLQEVGSAGEVPMATLSEENFTPLQCSLFSRLVRISVQQLANDDLSAFSDIPVALMRSAKRSVSDLIYRAILANAGTHFGTGNANYFDGAGSVLSAASLGVAIKMLRVQTDSNNSLLDYQPYCLLVPASLEQTAKALLNSSELARTGDSDPTGNPLQNALVLAVEPRLESTAFSGYSSTAWYLFSTPDTAPVNVGFLNGQESPTVTSFGPDSEAETLGFAWRTEL